MRCIHRSRTFLVLLVAATASACATPDSHEPTVSDTEKVSQIYYTALAGKEDLSTIPLREDVRFESPRFTLENASSFREALGRLVPGVRSLEIRHQLIEPGTVLTVYELDLGAPGGPIPMAERLRIVDGQLVDVQLIFDSSRLPTPPAS